MLGILLLAVTAAAEDAALEDLVVSEVELVNDGFEFTEGPIWHPEEGLLFSDIPADIIYRADGSVFREPSGKSNGLTLDNEGRLIACEHWNRRVTRTEADGSITVLADEYEGAMLNSPNDVIVRSDGAIFFTDPPYGLEGREAELDFSGVYMIPADGGDLVLLVDDFDRPNGLALCPDEQTFYVSDTTEGLIRAFDIAEDGSLSNDRLFCELPGPDGMKVDVDGRIWSTASDGIRIYMPDGEHVGTVEFPQMPANCAFGGDDSRDFYVTARTGVYRVRSAVEGIRPMGETHPDAE